jgi:hypothetical protein
MRKELETIRNWANEKIAAGQEPPWAWYQYMKLVETCDAILTATAATTPLGSPESEQHSGAHLRLVDDSDRLDSARHHQSGLPIQLPM